MIPARQFAAASTASRLIAGAFFVFLFSAADLRAEGSPGNCKDAVDLAVARANGNNVSILLGNGSGAFAPAVNYDVDTSDPTLCA